jgi:hypothetical protein
MTWRGSCGVQVRRDGGSKNPPIDRVLEVAGYAFSRAVDDPHVSDEILATAAFPGPDVLNSQRFKADEGERHALHECCLVGDRPGVRVVSGRRCAI